MPRNKRELSMQCAGCGQGERRIELDRLLVAFGGLSQEAADRATEEFEKRACLSCGLLRVEQVGALCRRVLVPVDGSEAAALCEIQLAAARAAEKPIRATCPRAEPEDVRQTAVEAAIRLFRDPDKLLAGFDIDGKRRDGRPATIKAYVTKAVARDAAALMRRDFGVRRVDKNGTTMYEPNPQDLAYAVEDGDIEGASEASWPGTIGLTGAIHSGYPITRLDGAKAERAAAFSAGDEESFRDPADSYQYAQGVLDLAEVEQRETFSAIVGALPAHGNEQWFETARVLKAVVDLDPALCDSKGNIVEQRVARAAGYSNSTVWRRNHVLPLIKMAARQPGVALALSRLCDRLEGLTALYARWPHTVPIGRAQKWSTKVLHLAFPEEIRALLSELQKGNPRKECDDGRE